MLISVNGLLQQGVEAQTVARLAGLEGTTAHQVLLEVSAKATELLREQIETAPSIDPNRPDRHVFTLAGQIVGIRTMTQLIEEAGLWLRETHKAEGAPQ